MSKFRLYLILAALLCSIPCFAKPQQIKVAVISSRFPGNDQESMEENLRKMLQFFPSLLVPKLAEKPDLVVFSECIDEPYYLATLKEKNEWNQLAGSALRDYFRALAKNNQCFVVYPHLMPAPGGGFFNAVELFDRTGAPVGRPYYKQYLPKYEQEGGTLHGTEVVVWDTELGRIAPLVCFDLNFDELLHQVAAAKPDLIVFPSWYHGDLMQNYWAYRCASYFIGAYSGESSVVNPLGKTIDRGTPGKPDLMTVFNPDFLQVHWDYNREKLAAAKAKYGDKVHYTGVDHLGVVLLSSSIPGIAAGEVAGEFGIAPWRDYYSETVKARMKTQEVNK